MKTLIKLLIILLPGMVRGQNTHVYAGLDMGVGKANLNTNFHVMFKTYNVTLEPTFRLYTMGNEDVPLLMGSRLGYEYGEVFSITPFIGLYYGYHGREASDKQEYNGGEWEYGARFKWSPESQDAAGFYIDISRLKRFKTDGITPFASVTVGMTVFEPNNKKD